MRNTRGVVKWFIMLRDAIFIAHAGKYEKLDVHTDCGVSSWDILHDSKWQRYKQARGLLSKHKWLECLLIKIKAV